MIPAAVSALFTAVSVMALFLSSSRRAGIFWSLFSGFGFAVIFLVLGSETLAILQGAITLGVIALLVQAMPILEDSAEVESRGRSWIAVLCGLVLWCLSVLIAFRGVELNTPQKAFETLSKFGMNLVHVHFFDLIVMGVLLFTTFVGVAVIARAEEVGS